MGVASWATLAALALVFHLRLLAWPVDRPLPALDIANYFDWIHGYLRERLRAGSLPLWNPYIYCGVPFAANPQTGVFYPPVWLCAILPVNLSQRVLVVAHVIAAAGFMQLFLRRLSLRPGAALLGAAAYALGGYCCARAAVGHLTTLFAAAWLPLILYCYESFLLARAARPTVPGRGAGADRAFGATDDLRGSESPTAAGHPPIREPDRAARRPGSWRWLIAAGLALGAQVLAGEPQSSYYTALTLTAYALVRGPMASGAGQWRSLRRHALCATSVVAVFALAGALAAVQILPSIEFARHSDRATHDFRFAAHFSARPLELLTLLVPWRGPEACEVALRERREGMHQTWESAGYVGMLTLALAGLAWTLRGDRRLRAVGAVALMGIVLALGRYTPAYRWLFDWLPGLSLFRIPRRAVLLLVFSLAVMGACGAQRLIADAGAPAVRRWCRVTAGLLALIALSIALIAQIPGLDLLGYEGDRVVLDRRLSLRDPLLLAPLASLSLTAVVLAGAAALPRRLLAPALLACLSADLFWSTPGIPAEPGPDWREPAALLSEVKRAGSYPRILFRCDLAGDSIPVAAAVRSRVEITSGYWPVALRRYYALAHALRGARPDPAMRHTLPDRLYRTGPDFPLRALNVRYATRWSPQRGGYELREDPRWLPRAWLVERCRVIPDEQETLRHMSSPSFDPAAVVLLERPPRLALETAGAAPPGKPTAPPGVCLVRRRSDQELEIDVQADRDSYLVISELFYPGWKATLDGRPVKLERCNYALTALPVPAGTHHVRCQYAPWTVRLGLAISGTTLLASLMLRKLRLPGFPRRTGPEAHRPDQETS